MIDTAKIKSLKKFSFVRLNFLSIISILLLVIMVISLPSCTQERQPCLVTKIASLKVRCVHLPTDTSQVVFTDTVLPKPVWGAVGDGVINSLIYSASSTFTLSLSQVKDSCMWMITTDSFATSVDSIWFYYERKLNFISNACGYTYFFALDSVKTTKHNIDSIKILNNSVTNNVNTEQLKVYIHPNF